MLQVPPLRQPDDVSCLPTCVEAVLRFHGHTISREEIRTWCFATPLGADADLAVQGLEDAGVEAELIRCEGISALQALLLEGRPPIVALHAGDRWFHSVVVCSVHDDAIVVMDPASGDYVRLAREAFAQAWLPFAGDTLLVGKRSDLSRLRHTGLSAIQE